jgi:hypothetical protein
VTCGALVLLALLLAAACSQPPPPPPPAPPPLEVMATVPQEALSFEGRTRPVGVDAQAIEILVNGRPVLRGTLSEKAPRNSLQAEYEGHALVADCTLAARVECSISVDGELQDAALR